MTIHDILEENTRLKSQIVGGIWDGQYTPNINGEVSVRLTENAFLTLKTTRGISIQLSFWNLDGLRKGRRLGRTTTGLTILTAGRHRTPQAQEERRQGRRMSMLFIL